MKKSTEVIGQTAEAVQAEASSFGRPLAEREEYQLAPMVLMQQQQHGACPVRTQQQRIGDSAKDMAQQWLSGRK